jgi:phosphate acetyltransferase
MTEGVPSAHLRLDALIASARGLGAPALAIVYPVDAAPLIAAAEAAALGLLRPVLVGPAARIASAAMLAQVDIQGWRMVDTEDDPARTGAAAAARATALAKAGEVAGLVKGSLHSDTYLRAAFAKGAGLRTARRISHAFWFDCPRYHKPLIVADAVVNIAPNTLKKQHIIANAVSFAHSVGIAVPKVAIVSAVETPTAAVPTSVEAGALVAWARDNVANAIVEGPFAMDNAISLEAARIKGLRSEVAGDADILIVPNAETGNILYKSLVYLGGAECAGLVLGATVPIVLTSRADSARARVASCALAVLNIE